MRGSIEGWMDECGKWDKVDEWIKMVIAKVKPFDHFETCNCMDAWMHRWMNGWMNGVRMIIVGNDGGMWKWDKVDEWIKWLLLRSNLLTTFWPTNDEWVNVGKCMNEKGLFSEVSLTTHLLVGLALIFHFIYHTSNFHFKIEMKFNKWTVSRSLLKVLIQLQYKGFKKKESSKISNFEKRCFPSYIIGTKLGSFKGLEKEFMQPSFDNFKQIKYTTRGGWIGRYQRKPHY